MSRIRKATAVVSIAALMGTGGLGAAQAATSDSATSTSTSTSAARAMRHGGQLSSTQLGAIATQLGVTTTQLKAAMQASKPADGAGQARGDAMATALASALGADVAKIRTILDANRPAKPGRGSRSGTPPAKPDSSRLAAALASGLGIDQTTAQAALDKLNAARKADHATRESAMYAAVAAQLNVSTGAVKAAFEANRPAKPSA